MNSHFRMRTVLVAVGVLVVGLLVVPALTSTPAGAAPATPHSAVTFTHSISGEAPVVVNSNGTGYLAWTNSSDAIEFCTVAEFGTCTHPIVLPLPTGANWGDYDVDQPFPVVGGGAGQVLVVAPSYIYSDTLIWTSTNGGVSFGKPVRTGDDSFAGQTSDDDVLLAPIVPTNPTPDENTVAIASHNPGAGYSFTGAGTVGALDPPQAFGLPNVPGGVDNATLGFVDPAIGQTGTDDGVEVIATDANDPGLYYYWDPYPGASGQETDNGPYSIGHGLDPRLAQGPDGLYLLTEDVGTTSSAPLNLDVRKWNDSTHKFGAPTKVASVPSGADASDQGGFAEDSATGELTVAWPLTGSDGSYDMFTWTSVNGGSSFSAPQEVAQSDGGYTGPARLATHNGTGLLTFADDGGGQLIDLAPPPAKGGLTALSPDRILDTRSNLGAHGPVGAGKTITLSVDGVGGVPSSGVAAVVVNVTVTAPTKGGYLTVYPDGHSRPATSNLNFSAHQTIPNLVIAPVGSDGKIDIYNGSSGTVQVLGDVSGWIASGSPAGAGGLSALSPDRILDTRSDLGAHGPVGAGKTITLSVDGVGGVPSSDVSAVVLNVTATGAAKGGYLTVYPDGTARPSTSNVNFPAGVTIPNLVIAPVGADGKVDIYNGSSGTVQVLGDISGWYAP